MLLMFYGLVALFSHDGRSTGLIQQRVISLSCKTSFCRLSLASAEADGSGRKAAPTHASLILLLIKTLNLHGLLSQSLYNVQIIRFYNMSIHGFTNKGLRFLFSRCFCNRAFLLTLTELAHETAPKLIRHPAVSNKPIFFSSSAAFGAVPSGYPNPTRYPVFLPIPDPTRFSFRNHRVAGNPKHRVLPDISGKPEVSGTTRYSGYHP